ncbi:MAG: hypothetical protein JNL98_30510 [Bryobacterales bacterium]|nr:hypothetical protein [Bryobacterales bacterium]
MKFLVLFMLAMMAAKAQPPAPPHPNVKHFIPYKEYTQAENEQVLAAFEGLRVADVSDGMDAAGLAGVGLVDADIKTLWRDTDSFSHRIIGIAVTCRYVPTNRREPKMDQPTESRWYREITTEAFQAALFPGSVLVIDGDQDGDTRTIGSSNLLGWKKRGALGVVTSGAVGDTDEIIRHKVPLYYKRLGRGYRPGRNELESVNRPVTIGGVLVRPGDVIVADGDGVIVVPREHALEVAKASMRFLDNIGLDRYKQRKKQ